MSKKIESVRYEKEIEEVLSRVDIASEDGSAYPGMSYEDGVKYAIEWMLSTDAPDIFE